MALRIACDLDGTLADMDGALQQEAERLFGPRVDVRAAPLSPFGTAPGAAQTTTATDGTPAPAPRRALSSAEWRRLWAQVRRTRDFWTGLAEIEPGAVARLGQLAAAHRWDVLFITQRPNTRGETAQRQSQRWLSACGFEHPSVYIVTTSRGRVAASLGLDALVDDHLDHCVDVTVESSARPLLVWRAHRAAAPAVAAQLGIEIVGTAGAAFDRLDAMTHERRPRGLVARIREAIGVP